MFAVLIMGFGVIMIAAMLPVALRTTQNTRESTTGSGELEGAFHVLEAGYAARDPAGMPLPLAYGVTPFPEVVTFPSNDYPTAMFLGFPLLNSTLGDRISSSDPRSAWVPFYYQDANGPIKLTLVAVAARNVPSLSDANAPPGSLLRPGLFFTGLDNGPLPVAVTMNDRSVNVGGRQEQVAPNTVTLAGRAGVTDPQVKDASVDGAAVVVRDNRGVLRVLRLGKPAAGVTTGLEWEMAPGGDFEGADARAGVNGYLVGRMLRNPGDSAGWSATGNPYVGPTQVTQVLENQTLH